MGRVSQATIEQIKAIFDSLPDETKSKCALCRDTLTHITKKIEVETGAGTVTVTRVFADKIKSIFPKMPIYISRVSPVIGTHTGPSVLSITVLES